MSETNEPISGCEIDRYLLEWVVDAEADQLLPEQRDADDRGRGEDRGHAASDAGGEHHGKEQARETEGPGGEVGPGRTREEPRPAGHQRERGGSEQEVAVTIGKRKDSMDAFQKLERLGGRFEGLEKFDGPRVWKWEGPNSEHDGFVFSIGNNRRIGVSTTTLTKQLAEFFGVADGKGVLVTSVSSDSPASKAGIRAGDVITAVDGEKIENAGDLSRALGKKNEGDATLTIVRDKNQRSITVTPTAAPGPAIAPSGPGTQGMRVVIPRINIPVIPPINIMIPGINIPTIPEINVNNEGLPRGRAKTIGVSRPI